MKTTGSFARSGSLQTSLPFSRKLIVALWSTIELHRICVALSLFKLMSPQTVFVIKFFVQVASLGRECISTQGCID